MLYLYDKSFIDKMRNVLPKGQVIHSPVEKFYERYLMTNQSSSIKMPAVSIWRTGYTYKPSETRHWLGVSNQLRDHRLDSKGLPVATSIQSIPVDLSYSLDIWANNDIDRDDLMTELLYFLTLYPNVTISYLGREYIFPLLLGEPEDLTDVSQFEESGGDLYRASIPVTIPDARILYNEVIRLARFIKVDMVTSISGKDNTIVDQTIIGRHKDQDHC